MHFASAVLGALCVSAVFGESIEKRGRPKVHIKPHLYPKIVRYTNFSSASYTVPCPKPPYGAVVVDYINVKPTTTQATLFRSDALRELILAFPGSTGDEDMTLDDDDAMTPYESLGVSKCQGCGVHRGFLTAWNSASHPINKALNKARKKHPGYKIIVTGHSLGAALASLAYSSLKGLGYDIAEVYTYGQPRVGNPAYADHIDSLAGASFSSAGKFHRVTHTYDGVPQVPSESLGFRHSRTEYWELDTKSGGQSARRTFRCFGQEPADCNASRARGFTNAAHGTYSGIELGDVASCGI